MHTSMKGRIRTGLAVLGAAAVLVAGVDLVSYAGGGHPPVLLGAKNKEKKTTSLTNKKSGAVLSLKGKSTSPLLKLSNGVQIPNLNASMLGGKSVSQIDPTGLTFSIGNVGDTNPTTVQAFQTTTLPSGKYHITLSGLVGPPTSSQFECLVTDLTRLNISSPTPDLSALFLAQTVDSSTVNVSSFTSTGIFPVVTGNRLVFVCQFPTGTQVIQPPNITITPAEATAPIPGMTATTFPKSAANRLTFGQ